LTSTADQKPSSAIRLPFGDSKVIHQLPLHHILSGAKTSTVVGVVRTEERWWCAELHRLHGVFLTTMGADETQIEASFSTAIRIAKEQKSVSLEKRAEATYAEYRGQTASGATPGSLGRSWSIMESSKRSLIA
jgi:hypothetical protein